MSRIEQGLSVIIPTANEYPQNAFTLQGLFNELEDFDAPWEAILIDNWCPELEAQNREQDKTSKYFQGLIKQGAAPWLKYRTYTAKLSHWNAKNVGIESASYDTLFFMDAHCLLTQGVLREMYHCYREFRCMINGSVHLPIRYLLEAPGRDLIYRARFNETQGSLHYVFTRYDRYRNHEMPFKVPCMSTCGMMIDHRLMTEAVGGWPKQLGIYGGGENFLNYTLALLGYNVMIYPHPAIEHYAERRGYHWNWLDYQRNRMIAIYLVGGLDWLDRFVETVCSDKRVNQNTMNRTRRQITSDVDLVNRRGRYKEAQATTIEAWLVQWIGSPLAEFKDGDRND